MKYKYLLRIILILVFSSLVSLLASNVFLTKNIHIKSVSGIKVSSDKIGDEFLGQEVVSQLVELPSALLRYDISLANNLRVKVAVSDKPETYEFNFLDDKKYETSLVCLINNQNILVPFNQTITIGQGLTTASVGSIFKESNCKGTVSPYIPEKYNDDKSFVLVYEDGFNIHIKPNIYSILILFLFSTIALFGFLILVKEVISFVVLGGKYFLK